MQISARQLHALAKSSAQSKDWGHKLVCTELYEVICLTAALLQEWGNEVRSDRLADWELLWRSSGCRAIRLEGSLCCPQEPRFTKGLSSSIFCSGLSSPCLHIIRILSISSSKSWQHADNSIWKPRYFLDVGLVLKRRQSTSTHGTIHYPRLRIYGTSGIQPWSFDLYRLIKGKAINQGAMDY